MKQWGQGLAEAPQIKKPDEATGADQSAMMKHRWQYCMWPV